MMKVKNGMVLSPVTMTATGSTTVMMTEKTLETAVEMMVEMRTTTAETMPEMLMMAAEIML